MNRVPKLLRVILADDHALVRAGIRALLEKLPWVQVLREAGDGREVIELVGLHRPDVILMDIGMPGLNGLEAAARIAADFPEVRVVMLSMHQNEEYVWRALKLGVAGYLLKQSATAELSAALESVSRGEIYLSRAITSRWPRGFPADGQGNRAGPLERLTARQREILQLIAEGQTTKSIADTLSVSPKTIEYHRLKLMDALDVHDVPGLVRFAVRVGLVAEEA